MSDNTEIVISVGKGDKDPIRTIAEVHFCESSASISVENMIIHIPWSELAKWQTWLAWRVEEEQ